MKAAEAFHLRTELRRLGRLGRAARLQGRHEPHARAWRLSVIRSSQHALRPWGGKERGLGGSPTGMGT